MDPDDDRYYDPDYRSMTHGLRAGQNPLEGLNGADPLGRRSNRPGRQEPAQRAFERLYNDVGGDLDIFQQYGGAREGGRGIRHTGPGQDWHGAFGGGWRDGQRVGEMQRRRGRGDRDGFGARRGMDDHGGNFGGDYDGLGHRVGALYQGGRDRRRGGMEGGFGEMGGRSGGGGGGGYGGGFSDLDVMDLLIRDAQRGDGDDDYIVRSSLPWYNEIRGRLEGFGSGRGGRRGEHGMGHHGGGVRTREGAFGGPDARDDDGWWDDAY